eukprot:6550666-Prymnesium_polylepis.1
MCRGHDMRESLREPHRVKRGRDRGRAPARPPHKATKAHSQPSRSPPPGRARTDSLLSRARQRAAAAARSLGAAGAQGGQGGGAAGVGLLHRLAAEAHLLWQLRRRRVGQGRRAAGGRRLPV